MGKKTTWQEFEAETIEIPRYALARMLKDEEVLQTIKDQMMVFCEFNEGKKMVKGLTLMIYEFNENNEIIKEWLERN